MHITGALVLALLTGSFLSAGLSSLSVFLPVTEFHIPLKERQKEIVREQGLPEVYDELTAVQRDMIMSIEELLEEVEKKYGKEMIFESYQPGTREDPDTVSVQFRDPDWDRGQYATVTRTEEHGVVFFSDDYPGSAGNRTEKNLLTEAAQDEPISFSSGMIVQTMVIKQASPPMTLDTGSARKTPSVPICMPSASI